MDFTCTRKIQPRQRYCVRYEPESRTHGYHTDALHLHVRRHNLRATEDTLSSPRKPTKIRGTKLIYFLPGVQLPWFFFSFSVRSPLKLHVTRFPGHFSLRMFREHLCNFATKLFYRYFRPPPSLAFLLTLNRTWDFNREIVISTAVKQRHRRQREIHD